MKTQMKKHKNLPGRHPDPRFDTEESIKAAAARRAQQDLLDGRGDVNPFAPGSIQFMEYNRQFLGSNPRYHR